jgi:predicted nucleic acid-binding protein
MPMFLPGTPGVVADLLIDTDVFIDHLRGAAQLQAGRHRLHYSVITRAELFAGNTATALTTQLLAPFRELTVDRSVAERAGRVVREFGLRLPDALIAATALEKGLQLSTRNTKDFENVRGLRLRSLH